MRSSDNEETSKAILYGSYSDCNMRLSVALHTSKIAQSIRQYRLVVETLPVLFGLLSVLLLLATCGVPVSVPEVELDAPHIEITFGTNRGVRANRGRGAIYAIAADGTQMVSLVATRGGLPGGAPSWSPDGTCLSFEDILPEEIGLTIHCADGHITHIPRASYGVWSPDGKRFAFHCCNGGETPAYIELLDLQTGTTERLVSDVGPPNGNGEPFRLSWSPAGDWLAFEEYSTSEGWWICLVRTDGTQRHCLTSGRRPDWSPSRPEIAFDDGGALWLIDIDGSNRRSLTTQGKGDAWPSWSPTGEELVFESARDGQEYIYRIHRDGTGLVRVTTGSETWDKRPAWKPQ
jgi:hypothetical protein